MREGVKQHELIYSHSYGDLRTHQKLLFLRKKRKDDNTINHLLASSLSHKLFLWTSISCSQYPRKWVRADIDMYEKKEWKMMMPLRMPELRKKHSFNTIYTERQHARKAKSTKKCVEWKKKNKIEKKFLALAVLLWSFSWKDHSRPRWIYFCANNFPLQYLSAKIRERKKSNRNIKRICL